MHGSPMVNRFESHISRIKQQTEEQNIYDKEQVVSKSLLRKSICFCQNRDYARVKITGQ